MSWRDDKATEKQKELIRNMNEFSEYRLPDIDLEKATKGECSDYINANLALSHESILDCWDTTQGFDA